MEHCKDIKAGDEVEIRMDNEGVAKQLTHDSAINDDDIRKEAFRIWRWGSKKNNRVTFVRTSRRENKAGKILGS